MSRGWATQQVCRLLVALMVWAPYQVASAGMVSTDENLAAGAQHERVVLNEFISRAEVANALQGFGIDAASAKERVMAMSDAEARTLAGEIANAPAGGVYSALFVAAAIIGIVAWGIYKERNPW